MSQGFKCGAGGGTDLNYKVLAAGDVPASPRPNTIRVAAAAPITDHVFSVEQPEQKEGRVWFLTSAVSSVKFNMLKRNCAMLYPTRAKQCVNGTWTAVDFDVYLDGTWKQPFTYLFRNGDCTDITGGWTDIPYNAETITMELSGMQEDGGASVSTRTSKAIDLTAFSRLTANVLSYHDNFEIRVKDTSGIILASTSAVSAGEVPVDISGLDGAYYIELYGSAHASGGYVGVSFTVDSVWLA